MLVMLATLIFGDENSYFPADENVVSFVLDNRNQDNILMLEAWCSEDYGISFFDELSSKKHFTHGMLSRIVQAYLFIAIAHFIDQAHRNRIAGYGGYCSGIMPALTASGALSFDAYRNHLRRPLERLFQSMGKSMVLHDFSSSIVDFTSVGLGRADLLTHLAARGGIYIKDIRGEHVFEIISRRADLENFLSDIQRNAASQIGVGPFLRDTFAHTPEIDPASWRASFASVPLDTSSKMIFSSCGRCWRPEDGIAELRDFYADTMLEPLNMAACADVIRNSGEALVFVGSATAARYIFQGMGAAAPQYRLFDSGFLS